MLDSAVRWVVRGVGFAHQFTSKKGPTVVDRDRFELSFKTVNQGGFQLNNRANPSENEQVLSS